MREIKFRAWDKKNKKIVYEDTYVCDMTITFGGQVFCHDSYYEIHDYDFDLMQYIGLKDKKGKEIYEGDIVRDIKMMKVNRELSIHEIVFVGGSFCMRCLSDTIPIFAYDGLVLENMEIIGNIYENSELTR